MNTGTAHKSIDTTDAGPHAVTTADGIDYTYDDVGNLTEADDNGTTTTYTYNDRNQLTDINLPGTTDDLEMVYDADGTRVSRSEGDTTTHYIGDLYEIEYDGTTLSETRTNYTFAADHIAVRVDDGTTDTITYLFGDQIGSTSAAYTPSQNSNDDTLAKARYYPYGAPRGTAATLPTDHTYTGQTNDPGPLMYYKARYYQPTLGRFTQPDTIIPQPGNTQDHNRYTYVRGNPIRNTDPTGHCTVVDNWLYCAGTDAIWVGPGEAMKMVRVYGSLDADNVAMVVPGTGSSLVDRQATEERADALYRAAGELSDSVAVVACNCYDPPPGTGAAMGPEYAVAGADDVASAFASLGLTADQHVTVIGYSYGSVTLSYSYRFHGMASAVDDTIVLGSPGMDVHDVSALGVDGSHFWAGMAADDYMNWAGRFVHGPEPHSEGFGGQRFNAGVGKHGSYFSGVSLDNMARIVTGTGGVSQQPAWWQARPEEAWQ